jgi:tRNA-splicing ligase RtcB
MDMDWTVSKITKQMKDTAWSQLGTSGGGNHFVEFGILTPLETRDGVEAGKEYVAILTHSGSRGAGSKVCAEYTKRAEHSMDKRHDWVRKAKLAWLDLSKEDGQEYWAAMNLMGHYASANHDCIHRHLLQNLGAKSIWQIENHHNFAWKEIHNGVEMIVHRKGATPAGKGVLGVIPGSMADPAFVVEGLGNIDSLDSASHGAGRKMSRGAAKQTFTWSHWNAELERRGVRLLGAGIDEVPGVYKDINSVMACQTDLVKPIARFDPKIVKMASEGPSED